MSDETTPWTEFEHASDCPACHGSVERRAMLALGNVPVEHVYVVRFVVDMPLSTSTGVMTWTAEVGHLTVRPK